MYYSTYIVFVYSYVYISLIWKYQFLPLKFTLLLLLYLQATKVIKMTTAVVITARTKAKQKYLLTI